MSSSTKSNCTATSRVPSKIDSRNISEESESSLPSSWNVWFTTCFSRIKTSTKRQSRHVFLLCVFRYQEIPHLIIHNREYFSFLLDCSRLHTTSAGRHAWRSSSDVGRERPSIRIGRKRIWSLRGDFKKIHQDLWFPRIRASPGTKE